MYVKRQAGHIAAEVCAGFWWGDLREMDHLEDLMGG